MLDKQPLAAGPRMTVITNAGGPGVITTDEIVTGGGQLAKISPEAMEAYNSFLPGAWSHKMCIRDSPSTKRDSEYKFR